jgi:hypothetical protein
MANATQTVCDLSMWLAHNEIGLVDGRGKRRRKARNQAMMRLLETVD